jgi:hypothetical protein
MRGCKRHIIPVDTIGTKVRVETKKLYNKFHHYNILYYEVNLNQKTLISARGL